MRKVGFYKIKWATGEPPNPYWVWTVGYWGGKGWVVMAKPNSSYSDDYFQIQEVSEYLFSPNPTRAEYE